jgi:diacylglycerol kinase family enzyme
MRDFSKEQGKNVEKVLHIINSAGHGGAGTRAWEEFKKLWSDPIDSGDVVVTERAGHAREIAAARSDYEILAAVGGDGTVGEVISGIMERQGAKAKVAIVPGGTGNDIGRNKYQIPRQSWNRGAH